MYSRRRLVANWRPVVLKLLVPAILLGLVCFVVFRFLAAGEGHKNKNAADQKSRGNASATGEAINSKPSEPKSARLLESKADKNPALPVPQLKNFVIKKFQDLEAQRTVLISERERETPTGGEVWYLVGVKKPTPEQVAEARKFVGEVLSEATPDKRDEVDVWIKGELETYDPFGLQGQRAAIIKIPNDANQRMRGMIYSSADFESEKVKIDPSIEFNYEFENLKMYVRDDTDILERFLPIIKN